VQVGDLVVATFKAIEPTSWYRQLYNTQEPAIVIETNVDNLDHMVWIYYRDGRRLCQSANLKIVGKCGLSSR
jgi:hypothetical protein